MRSTYFIVFIFFLGVSSRQRLLAKPILRYSVWIICFLTCIGNIVVLWGRSVFRDENKTLSLVIRNLAVSDLLMGIYLFIIGYHDLKYKHFYNLEAHFWMESWTCVLTGILALVSSEVSMLLLVFLSIDRFFLIAIPYRRFSSISAKETMIVLVVIWSFGIGIAVIPGIGIRTTLISVYVCDFCSDRIFFKHTLLRNQRVVFSTASGRSLFFGMGIFRVHIFGNKRD